MSKTTPLGSITPEQRAGLPPPFCSDIAELPLPTRDVDTLKRDLFRSGFCLIKDALSPARVGQIRRRLDEQAAVVLLVAQLCHSIRKYPKKKSTVATMYSVQGSHAAVGYVLGADGRTLHNCLSPRRLLCIGWPRTAIRGVHSLAVTPPLPCACRRWRVGDRVVPGTAEVVVAMSSSERVAESSRSLQPLTLFVCLL